MRQWLKRAVDAGSWRHKVNRPLLDHREVLQLRQRLQAHVRPVESDREVAHRRVGDARSVYRGSGMDYEESRPYQIGDELRFMNWRLTARTGAFHVKVFREQRRPGVFVVVDRRSAMRFGSRVRLKAAQAARAACVAAFRGQLQNMAVGGVVLDPQPKWIPSVHGEAGPLNLLTAAAAPCPPLTAIVDQPHIDAIVKLMVNRLVRGSVVYLISDFADLDEGCRASLLQLALEHQVCAVHIVDPAEAELPPVGPLRLRAGAQAKPVLFDGRDAAIARAYEQAARAYFRRRRDLFVAQGIPYVRLSTDSDIIENEIPVY